MSWPTQSGWAILKDIILTFGGLGIIGPQAFSRHPSEWLLVTGLGMCGLGASFHIGTIAGGFFGRSSSSSSAPPEHSPPSSSSPPEH